MATVLSAPSPVHYTQVDIAKHEEAVTSPAQASLDSSSSERAIRNASIVAIVFCATLLGTIGVWLWYGMQHYQNCL